MSKQQQPTQVTKKRELSGVVVRKSGIKTVSVEVVRTMAHPLYGKQVKRTNKYLAHDHDDSAVVGEQVVIQECRPMSARKRWVVMKKAL